MLPQADNTWSLNEAAHLLNRAGFGGSPEAITDLHGLGRRRAVDSLLSAADVADAFPLPAWASDEQALADMRVRAEQRREVKIATRNLSPEAAEKLRREKFQQVQKDSRQHTVEGQAWWFRRLLNTKAPLREKMTLFWHDHFATSIQKVKQPVLMLNQNELFRQRAFGSFRGLTQAILMDPAMLLYLDSGSSRKGHPNENFAREVMELFTLGEGNYTEADVHAAARAFTGYELDPLNGKVTHNHKHWDESDKTILAKTGPFTGKDVINLIFDKPQPATFMARKIWQFFVSDVPPEPAITQLAATLRGADYQIAPLLREIFLSREFYAAARVRQQIKSPIEFLVQLLKQLEVAEPPPGFPITGQQQLGQVLFMPPNVAGWDWGQAWINTNTLLARYNLAGFLAKGAGPGSMAMQGGGANNKAKANPGRRAGLGWHGPNYEKIAPAALREHPAQLVDALIFRFFQGQLPAAARTSLIDYATSQRRAGTITHTEVAELCHLMLSTPYYQLC